MTRTSKSERARTPVVPRRSDVLKQDYLQSFKTRRFHFATDGKMKPLCRTLFYNREFLKFAGLILTRPAFLLLRFCFDFFLRQPQRYLFFCARRKMLQRNLLVFD
ncbi:hypothetical protein FS559_04595 [Treponema phagedenis]|nr:hypothetical protein FS559_04595 [Treponema phagedenis]